jgi:hypothetical protein
MLLRQDYLKTRKVGDSCTLAVHSEHREAVEELLRTVLAKSPHRFAKGQACLALARFLEAQAARARFVQRLAAKDFKEYEGVYGAAEFRRLRGADPVTFDKEAEQLYKRVVAEFANLFPSRMTESLGKQAQAALDEIRLLAIGKAAPDITGYGQQGAHRTSRGGKRGADRGRADLRAGARVGELRGQADLCQPGDSGDHREVKICFTRRLRLSGRRTGR